MALFAGTPSLVAWALGNFDDDETKKEYNDIPKGLKDLYWHYKVGGEWLRLPRHPLGRGCAAGRPECPEFSQPYRNSEAIDRFYELAEQTSQAKIRYETKRKAGEQAEVGKDLRFAQQFAHSSKALSDLRKRRTAIQQHPSLSPASKRKYLDEMDERMVDLARGVLERYDGYGK